ncbi:MAG: hypothetical protein KGL54_06655 [Sphingomonadales bacterium]|nr:hypothetical protein [Sphingomonadales bacterium]
MTSKRKARAGARTGGGAPLSSHPLFPAAIAAWFAALFGMGSMALRAQLLESAVRASHLDLLIPAAAPPLGFTARLLVAMLFALTGAVLGFALATLMVRDRPRSATPRARSRASRDPAATRPAAAAHRADGEASTGDDNDDLARLAAARDGVPARRRSLGGGLTSEIDDLPYELPLPTIGPVPSVLNVGELLAAGPLGTPEATEHAVPVTAEAVSAPAPVAAAPLAPPQATETAAEIGEAPIELAGPNSPVAPDPAFAGAGQPVPEPATPRRLVPRAGTAEQVLRDAPLETLGVVELVERFALALAARRSREDHAADLPTATAAPAGPADPGLPSAAAEAPAAAAHAPFAHPNPASPGAGRPFDIPAMLRPPLAVGAVEWFDPDQVEAELPPRRLVAVPEPATPADLGEDDEADTLDEGPERPDRFSSLLDMKPPIRAPQPDVAVMPGRLTGQDMACEHQGETEDALRHALAALQRMSGAA